MNPPPATVFDPNAFCIRCKKVGVPLVLGDWHPPWALCEECAAAVLTASQES